MRKISVTTKRMDHHTICTSLSVSIRARPFFSDTELTTSYSIDISNVPNEILSIPALTTLLPIAWAENLDIHVDYLDSNFYQAIDDIRAGYNQLFPNGPFTGDSTITADSITQPKTGEEAGAGLLFSGGIDSTTTLLRHRDEQPTLITIHGADLRTDQKTGFNRITNHVSDVASRFGTYSVTIRSNFREALNYRNLDLYYSSQLGRGWWGGVQFYIGIPGLCAPLTFAEGLSELYFAAGYTKDASMPVPQPYIINQLEWAGTNVSLDGMKLTRQDRIQIIADYFNSSGESLYIRSCFHDDTGRNCCACEKCYRTLLGLAAASIDPSECGYQSDKETLERIKGEFESGQITLSEIEVEYWTEVQAAMTNNAVNYLDDPEFIKWFQELPIAEYEENDTVPHQLKRRLVTILPPILGCSIADSYRVLKLS